uniref:Uncharacterized protein n=1 Tax=Anguilla anguilla TaxID=7936 RepID=A0A0E9RMI8_ANGAN
MLLFMKCIQKLCLFVIESKTRRSCRLHSEVLRKQGYVFVVLPQHEVMGTIVRSGLKK